MRRWTAAELGLARRLRRQRRTYAEIARRLVSAGYAPRSERSVRAAVHQPRILPLDHARAQALARAGLSLRKIAEILGVSKSWVATTKAKGT